MARDPERSRQAILDAAERLFAERGFDSASLADIGAAADVSRGTPGYFFGSKEQLYTAVLQRLFAQRDAAMTRAFDPVREWAAGHDERTLEEVLGDAVEAYLRFLHERPDFVRLIEREAVDGGSRLADAPHRSSAMEDALRALHRNRRARGLADFDVREAVVCLVSLTFFPVAHRGTFLPAIGVDADARGFVQKRRRQVVDVMLSLLGAGTSTRSGRRARD